MERNTQKGYLLRTDISGYTSFVAQTEIQHVEKAISILLETIIDRLDDMLTIVHLEGDAVFAYLSDEQIFICNSMLPLLDDTYLIFRAAINDLHGHANCPCRVYIAIPMLDLKFLVHHGEYIVQRVAGIREMT